MAQNIFNMNDVSIRHTLNSNNIYSRDEIEWYVKFNRYGCLDPYNVLTNTKEYVFFTKPDLHLYTPNTLNLNPELGNDPYFMEVSERYPYILQSLQSSCGSKDPLISKSPFITVLSNAYKTTPDLQGLSAGEMDGPTNTYGTTFPYRKDAWTGDEGVSFSMEFEDTRYLEIYNMLKVYEEYERLKTIGQITPPNINNAKQNSEGLNANTYITERRLHDVFGIYKFVVADDLETLIYWAYICGAYFNNVPRDAFNDMGNDGGLRFSVDFKAFCVDDLNPLILYDFNNLVKGYNDNNVLESYSDKYKESEGSWALCPYITKHYAKDYPGQGQWFSSAEMKYKYKLKWRAV